MDIKKTMLVLVAAVAVSVAAVGANIDDYCFRYDFSHGDWGFDNNGGSAADPITSSRGGWGVKGTNGYATAYHPDGYGYITDGAELLADDWSLAMSVKSCNVEKGIIFSVGSVLTTGKKSIVICSSGTPGRLHAAVLQQWTSYSTTYPQYRTCPTSCNLDGLGDTTNEFHSLVLVHRKGTQATGVVTFYWDGIEVGTLDTSVQSATRPFANGIQFSDLHGGLTPYLTETLGYSRQKANCDIAFQDFRFYSRALSDDEASLYAGCYPAAPAFVDSIDNFYFRYGFTTGGKTYEHNGCATEPIANYPCCEKVPGPNGYGTAGHPEGYGNISNGNYLLTNDWTIAMSMRSCAIENGILLSLGTSSSPSKKQLLVCSSSIPGVIRMAVCQNANSVKSIPTSFDMTGLGDVTNQFHTLVATYTHGDNRLRLYWDGELKQMDWNASQGGASGTVFADGFQFFAAHGGNPSGYTSVHCPEASYQDVRFATNAWTAAEARLYADAYPVADAAMSDIDDVFVRHDFSSGKIVVEGEGYSEGSIPMSGKGTAADGPVGEGTAAIPDSAAYGFVDGGLNRDWTVAMSFKSSIARAGVPIVSIGGTGQQNWKGLVIATSDPGCLHAATPQQYITVEQKDAYNIADQTTLSGLGDTTNYFHTLVISYSRDLLPGAVASSQSGIFVFYWDGQYAGCLLTAHSTNRPLRNGIQYGNVIGGTSLWTGECPYKSLVASSDDVRLQDMRFTTNVWTAAEAMLYAARYPVRRPSLENTTAWSDAASDNSFDTAANWTWGQLPAADQTVVLSSASRVDVGVENVYELGALRIEGEGAFALSGGGSISATNVVVAAGANFMAGGIVATPSFVLGDAARYGLSASFGDPVSFDGRLTFGSGAKLVFDADALRASDPGDHKRRIILTFGDIVLPDGETNVLAHFGVTRGSYELELSADGHSVYARQPSGFYIMFR